MERKEYNGWTNYETWNVALWLDNEEGTQEMAREMAVDAFANADGIIGTKEHMDAATRDLSDCLKTFHEENMPELSGVYADMLNASFSEVDWHEISEYWMTAIEDERKEMVEDDHRRERS